MRLWQSLQRWYYQRQITHMQMQRVLQTSVASGNASFATVDCLAVDLETTALEPQQGEIASIGWVPIRRNRVILSEAQHYYVQLQHGVGQSAIYHQISDSELAAGNVLAEVLDALLSAAAGKVLVFHFAQLDRGFLNMACKAHYGAPLLLPWIDTMHVEKRRLLQRGVDIQPGDLRLFASRHRYGLPEYPAHDALTDAIATAELLLAQVASLTQVDERNFPKLKQVF